MIALDREMPQHCIGCPCLYTLIDLDSDEGKVMVRACAANNLKVIYHCEQSENPPVEWMDFPKPQWCPWIDMSEPLYDKEFEREWLQHQLNILEE